jgi:hypothetical protein
MDSLTLADGVDRSLITAGLQQMQCFHDELFRWVTSPLVV